MIDLIRILKYARPVGTVIPAYVLLVSLAALFSVINLSILIPLLQVIFDQVHSPNVALSGQGLLSEIKSWFYQQLFDHIEKKGKLEVLYIICGLTAISILMANVFRYLSQLILARVRVRVTRNLRMEAFRSMLALNLDLFIRHPKGDLISRITTDIQEVEQSAVNTLKVFFKEPFLMVAYLIALLAISPKLTLYTLVLVPVAGVLVSWVAKRVKGWARKSQDSLGQIGHVVDESISGMRVIKVFHAQRALLYRFSKLVNQYANQTFQIAVRSNLSSPISEMIGTIVLVILLVIGGNMVLSENPTLSGATFIGFLIIFSQMLNPAKAMSVAFSQINRGLAASQRVFELIDLQSHKPQKGSQNVQSDWSSIRFQDVAFSYGQQPFIHSMNFEVVQGQTVALVGPSGGGKTTIADLLCRFYVPQSGNILIGDTCLTDQNKNSWLQEIAVVSQEPVLFNDSIRNNILIGKPNATDEELIKAAKHAQAHDFIQKLPAGYETNVGQRGDLLSGGQKQRITIARAFLKNPSLLILDEPTSALDAHSEESVRNALKILAQNRTTIHIAHQLSTVAHADQILVLDQGQIVERGTHEELIRLKGLYHHLTDLQTI